MYIAQQILVMAIAAIFLGVTVSAAELSQPRTLEAKAHIAAMAAHNLCSGFYVVGRGNKRSAKRILAEDIEPFFLRFGWDESFDFTVDERDMSVTVSTPGVEPDRKARYHGDQGCTILPTGVDSVFFNPVKIKSVLPDPATQAWPLGDLSAHATFPEVDQRELDSALSWAISRDDQNTRALVVVYRGKIIGERYAGGFDEDTPQISYSQGKSITAALIGVLSEQKEISLDDPAPIAEWQAPEDPRQHIKIRDLLNMSSGLEFTNFGRERPDAWSASNEHLRVYFDGINVFEHAVNQPLELPSGSQFRYRNSDPLTLGRIIRQTVEARGESYLQFPQSALFDRIGARNFVLETDAWGNFIMTGYNYGSAWDWARFGLLHLWDGVFEGERVLADGWVDFVRSPAPGDVTLGYGGLFWLNRGRRMDQVPLDAFWPAGAMGQMTVIIPSADMVVVRLGLSHGGEIQYMNEVIGRVLNAINMETLPD
ncbi:MAG: serine hydrolase domain-containing protein [Sphingomonadales bacterium]